MQRASQWALLAAGLLAAGAAGCSSAEQTFTGDRLQNLCNESLVVCAVNAGCALTNAQYLEGVFPGTLRVMVHSEVPAGRVVVRFLLTEMKYPGTELTLQAYEPGCTDLDEQRLKDVDIFALAGDEGILQFELQLKAAGDHLLEIFSDMSASFALTVEVIENI